MHSPRSKSPRVVIASGNHLSSNPRVVKEADALSAAGFEVTVIGGSVSSERARLDALLAGKKQWRYLSAFDVGARGAQALARKVQRRLGILLWTRAGIANTWQLFYGVGRIAWLVREQTADLVIGHWEPALPAVIEALGAGKRVGVDMEDWFSEDVPAHDRACRPVKWLAEMEARLLRHGRHTTCTSEAMADALVGRYACRRPVVLRNVFPRSEREGVDGLWQDRSVAWHPTNEPDRARPAEAAVSFHWFSQTIGPSRGLEGVLDVLGGLEGDWELHLRGNLAGHERWLRAACPVEIRSRVHVHGPVPTDELPSRIAEHDVGLATELADPPSRNLTVTNKFFQYLQGGLAVVASDTAGQREAAAAAPGAVALFRNGDAVQLRETLQRLVTHREMLRGMRSAAWAAGAELVWENEAAKLVESVERAMG